MFFILHISTYFPEPETEYVILRDNGDEALQMRVTKLLGKDASSGVTQLGYVRRADVSRGIFEPDA